MFFTKLKIDINKEVEKADQTNGLIIDVRSREEYHSGHIAKSRNIPLEQIGNLQTRKDQPLYLYCLSGARSAAAASILKRSGYTNITDMGSIMKWKKGLKRGEK